MVVVFSVFEKKVAFRYLKSPRKERFVSVIAGFSFLGITLGVATLVIVMSVMNGFRAELYQKLVGMRGHVMVMFADKQNNWQEILEYINKQEHILAAYPVLEKQAVITFHGQARGIGILGMQATDLEQRESVNNSKLNGNFKDFSGKKIAIGSRLAQQFRLNLGDKINLMIPDGNKTPFGNMPKQLSLEVSAIFEIGMHEFDKNIIFMPLKTAQDFFNASDLINHIDLILDNLKNSTEVINNLQNKLPQNLNIIDWKHSDSSIFHAVQVEKNVMFIILMLIIVIAAFNVISSLIMLVKDKTRDIAILRTMGATKNNILKIFFLTGSCIGISGTFIGLIIGICFALNIDKIKIFLESILKTNLFNAEVYFLSQLPAKIIWSEVFYVTIVTLLITFLATFYPAYKAARLDPVDALRL